MSMMFGGSKKTSQPIIITVDGKVIECDGPVNLRKQLMANKIDVYPLKAKITGLLLHINTFSSNDDACSGNCGGAGICGTCAVKVLSGAANLNPPSTNEKNTLRGRPADLRLSCCAKVNGPITIQTKP
ncbi:unnamed protein product [Sphagnum jensenii]|uniref:2Fe-2S ferredoxin-type domain-containing protein n=1 Tax=Sphagnum jensenii TaxID=128206 RepID=A0ABP0VEL5_9BRYO